MEDCLTQPYTTSTDKTHSARVATDNSDKDFTYILLQIYLFHLEL